MSDERPDVVKAIDPIRLESLFMAVAEELKRPVGHIARTAELHQSGLAADESRTDGLEAGLQDIQHSADMTVQLLDSYLTALRAGLGMDGAMHFEPVCVSAVLRDAADELRETAHSYGVTLQLDSVGRADPVLADRTALRQVLVSLGRELIGALPSHGTGAQHLQLAAHRTREGVVAGVYGQLEGLTETSLRRAREKHGTVRQPLVGLLPGSGAGIFVAEALLASMEARLRVGRFRRLPGFAVTLPVSEQMRIV